MDSCESKAQRQGIFLLFYSESPLVQPSTIGSRGGRPVAPTVLRHNTSPTAHPARGRPIIPVPRPCAPAHITSDIGTFYSYFPDSFADRADGWPPVRIPCRGGRPSAPTTDSTIEQYPCHVQLPCSRTAPAETMLASVEQPEASIKTRPTQAARPPAAATPPFAPRLSARPRRYGSSGYPYPWIRREEEDSATLH